MKSSHSKVSGTSLFFFLPLLFILFSRSRKKVAYVFMFLLVMGLSSCFLNFYRTNTKSSMDTAKVDSLRFDNRYFIIHFPGINKGLEQVSVNGDNISGKLVTLSPEHSKYLNPDPEDKKNRVKAKYKKSTLTEVHLYTNAALQNGDSMFSAPVSSFNRADVYQLNKSATSTNHVISTIGAAIGGFYVLGTIVLLATCNCPQVYVDNNGSSNFASGLYSGAVYSTLERMDYLPLTSVPANAQDISFKISNGKNEEQFINQVQLVQVNHLPNVKVLPDRHGNMFSYENTASPLRASTYKDDDIKNLLVQTDDKYYSFDNKANKEGFSDVILSFENPTGADKAKLIIHARNTYWGGLLHKEFIGLFGDSFDKWKAKQEKADPVKLQKWQTDQALPLMVYIKTATGWRFVDYFPLIGNTASRDMIMEINTADIKEKNVELKLETTYRFWDLDFAGIDYTTDQSLTKNIIKPLSATKNDGTDQREILINSDKKYAHLEDDESISFKYSVPATTSDTVSSYFLASGGYYHNLEHITGKTNYSKLYKFRKKGAFDKFSRERFQELQNVAVTMKK
ncbi:MAG: hypothetical protein ABI683_14985 [Ginsengibacter sp.]